VSDEWIDYWSSSFSTLVSEMPWAANNHSLNLSKRKTTATTPLGLGTQAS
jgi:hypothetical protein